MNKSAISHLVAGIGALAILSGPAAAQKDVSIYTGQSVKEHGILLSSWGSGTALESTEANFGGPNSIKVTTHGRFQGARLILNNPVDLKSAAAEPSAYLQLTYQIADRTGAGGMSGGGEGGPYGGGGKGFRGGPGGIPGGGQYGGGGQRGGDAKTNKPKPIGNFRVVLVTTDDKRIDTNLPLENARTQRDQWKSVAIPVATIPAIKETSGTIKEILLFGDAPGIVYVGEIRVVRDDTPIRVDDLAEQTVAKNDTLTFTASAEAGPTPLKYEWTIQGVPASEASARSEVTAAYTVAGEGRTFKHQFRKSGDYNVTLTVSDINGLKKPVTKKTSIHVTL